eukprot:g18342.t1
MAEQVEEEYSEDRRSPKKQRVDDDANEENQQSLEHLSQEVERMTRTIEAVNGKQDDHTLLWVQSAMERHLPNTAKRYPSHTRKAVEQMSQKSVQELVGKYSQEIVKSVDTLIRPSLLETAKQSGKKHRERFGEESTRLWKRRLRDECQERKSYRGGSDEEDGREDDGFNFVVQTAINQMNVKGKLDGEWVYQEAKGKGAKENQSNSVNLSSTSSTPLRKKIS